jgi:hypothetical protein
MLSSFAPCISLLCSTSLPPSLSLIPLSATPPLGYGPLEVGTLGKGFVGGVGDFQGVGAA